MRAPFWIVPSTNSAAPKASVKTPMNCAPSVGAPTTMPAAAAPGTMSHSGASSSAEPSTKPPARNAARWFRIPKKRHELSGSPQSESAGSPPGCFDATIVRTPIATAVDRTTMPQNRLDERAGHTKPIMNAATSTVARTYHRPLGMKSAPT